jgi:hypothetical protein
MVILELLFTLVIVGFFLCLLPICFAILIFIESLLFTCKVYQSIKAQTTFLKFQVEYGEVHSIITKALSLSMNNKKTRVPYYLVNAYLHIGHGQVFELNCKTKQVLRVFSYDFDLDRIRVEYKNGNIRNVRQEIVHYIADLEPSTYVYATYIPEGFIK